MSLTFCSQAEGTIYNTKFSLRLLRHLAFSAKIWQGNDSFGKKLEQNLTRNCQVKRKRHKKTNKYYYEFLLERQQNFVCIMYEVGWYCKLIGRLFSELLPKQPLLLLVLHETWMAVCLSVSASVSRSDLLHYSLPQH